MLDEWNRLEQVAKLLPDILDRLVFVGGGVTELLVTNSAGRKPRPTKDVDCIVEVSSWVQYHKLEEQLRRAGLAHDTNVPPLICRWTKDSLILDVMPTLEEILGFTNIWYKDAVPSSILYRLPSGTEIHIIHPVYYFSTKTEAFRTRGKSEFRTSHDFEDIVALVNGRAALVTEMKAAKEDVFTAMKNFWTPHLESVDMLSAIKEHVDAYENNPRAPIVMDRLLNMFG